MRRELNARSGLKEFFEAQNTTLTLLATGWLDCSFSSQGSIKPSCLPRLPTSIRPHAYRHISPSSCSGA